MQNKLLKKGLVFVIIVPFICFTGCFTDDKGDSAIKTDKNITIGLYIDCLGFHPWMESYDTETLCVNANIFNGLVEFDKDFRIVPALAVSWINPDSHTWRFRLREGVKFHNGNDFTAEDVKFTIELIKGNESSVLRDSIAEISEVKIINNYTVDIITKDPYPVLLNRLVDIFIVSKQYQEETESNWPIGTGAYKFVERVENDYILLEKFEDYWTAPPEVNKVIFKVLQGIEERKDALVSQLVDIIMVSSDYYEELSNIEYIDLQLVSSPSVIFLGFDFRANDSYGFYGEKNPVSDIRVRKAIYYAINISRIIEKYKGGFALPASQLVMPLVFGYNPEIERLPYNLDKARELMFDAGYEEGFEIVLDCIDSESQKVICEEIAAQLSEINIDVKLNASSVQNISKMFKNRNTSFYYLGWMVSSGDGGEIFDFLLKTVDEKNATGLFNFGYYSNSGVDRIAEQVSSLLNPKDRLDLIQQGFEVAMDDVAFIPLFWPQEIQGSLDHIDWSPRIDGFYKLENIGFK